ncbi:C40 family peptidase [Alkalicoccobacillus porphyridii]|uniref:NlpC/P60 family protein n=1 Tax=Alkalicoccobacillus porphyridii TaxID=2597270 RepID=A0A553ZVK4_9BACI|nr:C40 family peptidase [Alkalicoccobacillus porphyridii]TSB45462.1 NlpC/P60 family protein [Alkalicoccobacillus porphyridii]
MKRYAVRTSVATIWTDPQSAREIDRPALRYPDAIRDWLNKLTYEERLDLCTANRAQTQALFGQEVVKLREENGWAEVFVSDQPTAKAKEGYPGWLPIEQIEEIALLYGETSQVFIQSPTAWLYHMDGEKFMELSFQTRLPIISSEEVGWVIVQTPLGKGKLRQQDVRIVYTNEYLLPNSGQEMVDLGRQFLKLPYLWAGMSGFGFDCSGFVYQLHRAYGITIPRDASEQAKVGTTIEPEDLEPGDLLYFAYEEGVGRVHHVAMYAGDGRILHSPKTGKSVEEVKIEGMYKKEHCLSKRFWARGK